MEYFIFYVYDLFTVLLFFASVVFAIIYYLVYPDSPNIEDIVPISTFLELFWFVISGMLFEFVVDSLKSILDGIKWEWNDAIESAEDYISMKENAQGGDITIYEDDDKET